MTYDSDNALLCFFVKLPRKSERWYKLIQKITYLLVCQSKSFVSIKAYNSSETIKVNKRRCDVLYICNFIKEEGANVWSYATEVGTKKGLK